MKWRDLLLTLAVLLCVAPFIQAQTQPVGGGSGVVSGGIGRFIDGTATAPSIAFVNETNTGLYRVSSSKVAVSIAGTQRYLFDSGQYLSILNDTGHLTLGATPDTGLVRLGAGSMSASNSGTGKASLHTEGSALTLAVPAGGIGLATVATSSVGITGQGARLVVVCGPTAGTSSLLYYSGTSNTPVTLANAVGGGLIGC